ncbi:hypothetical protein C8R43DRAFT_959183 [Mycena crocata]|nr:hypothetical protein C8R43DRAFT_959183 [Mycena crocata]
MCFSIFLFFATSADEEDVLSAHGGLAGSRMSNTRRLKTASNRFWTENGFNFPDIEAAMIAVFGNDRRSAEAQAWTQYWETILYPIQPPKKPAKASNAEWTSKDAEWDAADW